MRKTHILVIPRDNKKTVSSTHKASFEGGTCMLYSCSYDIKETCEPDPDKYR